MSDYIINFTDPLRSSFVIRPYTSNGPKFPTTSELNDTSIAASSTLLLYGKGHPEYGERTDENLLNLLENFSGATEPVIKVTGMLWHKEVLYYKDTGGGFYVAAGGSPTWTSITLAGTGALPASANNGDYWWDNTGSPMVLYQYSADERNINGWIVRLYDEGAGAPTATPTREMQVYNGSDWKVLPDLDTVTALVGAYLLLDTSNGPLTGDLDITKVDPQFSLGGGTGWAMLKNDSGSGELAFTLSGVSQFEIGTTGVLSSAIAGYEALVVGDNDIPNKKYVTSLVAGAITGDTAVDGGTFGITGSPNTGTLTLTFTTAGSPEFTSNVVITGIDAVNIPFDGLVGGTEPATTVDDALTKAAPTNDPTFTGDVIVPSLNALSPSNAATDKAYVDNAVAGVSTATAGPALRHVASASQALPGLPGTFALPFTYTAGNNRLFVFKNGVKLYQDIIAYDDALFATPKEALDPIAGLSVVNVVGVSTGSPNYWSIGGDVTGDLSPGDTFEIRNDTGAGSPSPNGTYTVVSATTAGSPVTQTDVVVAETIPAGAVGDGTLGLNYFFDITLDGTTNTVGPINAHDAQTIGALVSEMQSVIDTAFGAGTSTVFLWNGNIRVQTTTLPGGSPVGDVILANLGGSPTPATRNLFDINNLGIDGFVGFAPVAGAQFGYYEDDGVFTGSPLTPGGLAIPGSTASNITLNTSPSVFDILEFILV